MSNFEERRCDWKRRMEDIIIEIVKETNDEGVVLFTNILPTMLAFNSLLDNLTLTRKKGVFMVIPRTIEEEE